MKFPIRIDAIWRGPLLAAAVTPGNAYVTLNDEGVHFRFGPLFDRTIPYDQIANVFPRSWPMLYGIGLRSNLRGVIGLIGSYDDVVEVRLTKRIRNWVLLFPCDRISVSLEEPERFVEELSKRIGLETEPIQPLTKPRRSPKQPKRAVQPATPETGADEPTAPLASRDLTPDASAVVSVESAALDNPEPPPSLPGLDAGDTGRPPATESHRPSAPGASTTRKPARKKSAAAKATAKRAGKATPKPAGAAKPTRPASPKGERRASSAPTTNGASANNRSGSTAPRPAGGAKRPKPAAGRNRTTRRRS
jgi:hypothetical protein